MKEINHNFFGMSLTARFGEKEQNIIPVSIIDPSTSEAWSRVFHYDASVEILEQDEEKVSNLLAAYQKKSQKGASFFLLLVNSLIALLRAVECIIKSFLGLFVGFGFIGIIIIFAIMLTSLMVSVYILMIAAPLYLFAYLTRYFMNRRMMNELSGLQKAVLEQV